MTLRNAIRRVVNREQEYRLRRLLMRLMPVKHRSGCTHIVHACTWKTASQWVRIVLSDPSVYRYSGLSPFAIDHSAATADTVLATRDVLLSPAYVPFEVLEPVLNPQVRAFFVLRDPRDVLVSRYYSRLSAHPLDEHMAQHRNALQVLDKEQGLLHVLESFDPVAHIMRSWATAGANNPFVLLSRYEDLTGPNAAHAWRQVFTHCDIGLPDSKQNALLDRYAFQRMSGGRKPGDEDPVNKYRKGVAGDWRNHFTTAVEQRFLERTGDLIEVTGY